MANTKLPMDAKGREIPLDTECLYTYKGEKQDVLSFTYYRKEEKWEIETDLRIVNSIYLYITPPDSWEKLEEDLGRAASCCEGGTPTCAYTRQPCAVCKFHGSEDCTSAMCADVASRIRRLRGEN